MASYIITRSDELYHHGIKGQKWGKRRWQNEDGSLTPEGYEHYGVTIGRKEYKEMLKSGREYKKDFRKEKAEALRTSSKENRKSVESYYDSLESGMAKSRAVLERNAGHDSAEKRYNKKSLDLSVRSAQKAEADLHSKVQAAAEKKRTLEKQLGVYGDDLDGWDSKTGKENYGIDAKQYKQVMKVRKEYESLKSQEQQSVSNRVKDIFNSHDRELASKVLYNSSAVKKAVSSVKGTAKDYRKARESLSALSKALERPGASKNEKLRRKYDETLKQCEAARKKYDTACSSYANKLLGSHGNDRIYDRPGDGPVTSYMMSQVIARATNAVLNRKPIDYYD